MSRRESRASNGARQADALAEYENLKKKFLLANKHITKLNSTLSIRIEELNAEITLLQVENLRLRQSEISLLTQLKREREKSRKVMADTEAATLQLTKHLAYLRHTFNISLESTPPPSPAFPPATKPPLQTTNACIPGLRVAKPPNVPGIHEEEEPCASSSDGELEDKPSSAKRKSKSKSHHRLSASKLPLPPRAISPPEITTPHPSRIADYQSGSSSSSSSGVTAMTKRKGSRRQSGLLSIDTENLAPPRPASPAFGSPIRLEAARAEVAEEIAVLSGNLEVDAEPEHDQPQDGFDQPQLPPPVPKKEKRRTSKSKDKDPSPPPPPRDSDDRGEREYAIESMKSREKKRQREDDLGDLPLEGTKGKQGDVTRAVLQPINCNIGYLTAAIRVQPNSVRDKEEEVVVSARTFLVSSTPSTIPRPAPPEPEPEFGPGGRERRVRKSINYAEPKLNTKMRKPDPPPGTEPPTRKKRSSAAAVMTTTAYPKVPEPPPLVANIDRDTHERRSSGEFLSRNIPDSMNPEMYPLPPSRPSSSADMMYHSPISDSQPPSAASRTSSSGNGSGTTASPSSTGATGSLRRKKSKPMEADDGNAESDGAEADGEYVPPRGLSAWVNIEGRGSRKSSSERLKKGTSTGVGVMMLSEVRRDLVEDPRRHSMAV